MSIVRVGHEATPHPGSGNRSGHAWCERPGGPAPGGAAVGAIWGPSERRSPKVNRMIAASTYGSPQKLPCGGKSARRTHFPWGETGVLGQGTDNRSRGARRGMDPSTYARVVEITSGRTISQQGLVATCMDPVHKGRPEARGGFWSDAWARMSEEGGVTPSEAVQEVAPTWGNTLGGQRSPGHSAVVDRGRREGMVGTTRPNLPRQSAGWSLNPDEETGKPMEQGVYACQRLSFGSVGKAGLWKRTCEPRSEPDSGNPTVRDRRGALRNVALGLRPGARALEMPPAGVRALNFYPDNRTHGSKGEWGDGLARRAPRP